jgi:hypothetical protein
MGPGAERASPTSRGEQGRDIGGRLEERKLPHQVSSLAYPLILLTGQCRGLEQTSHLGRFGFCELTVEIGAESWVEPVVGGCHVNASLSRTRPRCIRLRTVPTGTSSASATSW